MESFITSAGYAALILFAFLEAACVPISSEVVFGFAGVLAYQGHLNLVLIILLGWLAEMAGSYVSYYVGWYGGRPAVHKLGRFVLVGPSDIDRAERFLEGKGWWAIPLGRILPFVRSFTSVVVGLVRMPVGKFTLLNAIGTGIYVVAMSSVGYAVGSAWNTVSKRLSEASYVIVAVVVLVLVAAVVLRWRQFRKDEQGGGGGRHAGGGAAADSERAKIR